MSFRLLLPKVKLFGNRNKSSFEVLLEYKQQIKVKRLSRPYVCQLLRHRVVFGIGTEGKVNFFWNS